MNRARISAIAAAFSLAFSTQGTCGTIPGAVLDQYLITDISSDLSTSRTIVDSTFSIYQTFRVGVTGDLEGVGVAVSNAPAGVNPGPLEISIREVTPPGDLGGILTSIQLSREQVEHDGEFLIVEFPCERVLIEESDLLALHLSTTGGGAYGWRNLPRVEADLYPSGRPFIYSNAGHQTVDPGNDFGFQTFVIRIPEPTSAVLCLCVASAWYARRSFLSFRQRRRHQ